MPQASSVKKSIPPTQPSTKLSSTLSVDVLRVSQQELSSGNQQGPVFLQLSPGAVALQQERPVLQARVSRLLYDAIEREQQ